MQMKKSVIATAGAVFRGEKRKKNIFRAAFALLLAAVIGGQRPLPADRIGQEHGDGHGSDPARNGRDERRLLRNGGIVDVPRQFAVDTVDPDVDDHGALFDHIRGDKIGLSDGGNEDIGARALLCEPDSTRMADGDRRIGVEEQQRHRPPDNIAPADDDGALAPRLHAVARGLGRPIRARRPHGRDFMTLERVAWHGRRVSSRCSSRHMIVAPARDGNVRRAASFTPCVNIAFLARVFCEASFARAPVRGTL